MARPKSEKKSEPTAPAERRVLPMELHIGDRLTDALLERAAKLMVIAGYRAYGVRIKVAGKEKGYGLMESFYLDMVQRGNPPTGPGPNRR